MNAGPQVIRLQSRDLDELAEGAKAAGFRLDRTPLGPGAGGRFELVPVPSGAVIHESFTTPFRNRAVVPRARWLFSVLTHEGSPVRFQGHSQSLSGLRLAPPGAEFQLNTSGPMNVAHFAFDADWFEELFRVTQCLDLPSQALAGASLLEVPEIAKRLRRLATPVSRQAACSPERAGAIALALCEALAAGKDETAEMVGFDTVGIACDYIEAHLAGPIPLAQLCRVAGAGSRGLQRAFGHFVGVPPSEYIKRRRLLRARRHLRSSAPEETTVAAIASSVGLQHAGRFSSHYQELFGEPPSATLAARDWGQVLRY